MSVQPQPIAQTLAQQDVEAIARAREDFLTGLREDRLEGMMALLTDDCEVFPSHEEPLLGLSANQSWHEARMAEFTTHFETSTDELFGGDSWALERFSYTLRLTPKAGGDPVEDTGNCFWLWRREADGSWKVARAMWNSPQPIPDAG